MFLSKEKFNPIIKVIEECGELQQILAKKLQFPDSKYHPDNSEKTIHERIEDEVADVYAALHVLKKYLDLGFSSTIERMDEKIITFEKWMDK
jgi:NTP pyrophosphatase (non-canonical NTP hydrolase)